MLSRVHCPYCEGQNATKIDQKWLVARLYRCRQCELRFRHPPDSNTLNNKFYQTEYKETDITRNTPPPSVLSRYKLTGFKDSGKDYADKVQVVKALVTGEAQENYIIDYGSSWAYASFQLKTAGFRVHAYEISVPMAEFGRANLDINVSTRIGDVPKGADLIFTAHVIEHLASPRILFEDAQKLLKKNGLLVCFSPNGSDAFKVKEPAKFKARWGFVHPTLPTSSFYKYVFRNQPYLITSTPHSIDAINAWDRKSQLALDDSGDELLVIAKFNTR
jgi:hypothetical protein